MTVGERIRQRRIELNMTQEELAKKAGYKSRSSINKIECSRDLPITKVKKVAYLLDCKPSYLMGWEDENFTEVQADVDIELASQTAIIKQYMLKFANLPEEKRNQIMSLIDMIEEK